MLSVYLQYTTFNVNIFYASFLDRHKFIWSILYLIFISFQALKWALCHLKSKFSDLMQAITIVQTNHFAMDRVVEGTIKSNRFIYAIL